MSASLAVDADGVAVITLLNPPMNALAPAVLMGLKDCLARAQADAAVKAIVVTGAAGKFSAGFDITYLAKQQRTGDTSDMGTDVNAFLIKLLEAGAKPSVAGAWARAEKRPSSLTQRFSHRERGPRRRPGGCHGLQRARGQQGRPAGSAGAAAWCAPSPVPLAPTLAALTGRAGIIPGFGGTARLPRLVGVEKALTMMLRSKSIKARPLPDPAPHRLSQPL